MIFFNSGRTSVANPQVSWLLASKALEEEMEPNLLCVSGILIEKIMWLKKRGREKRVEEADDIRRKGFLTMSSKKYVCLSFL